MEEWKEIEGFNGLYLINKNGEVVSHKFKEPKILKQKLNPKTNEYEVCLSKNNKRSFKMVARLVAETFIPNPNKKPYVMHKDSNTKNNNVDNLQWVFRSEIHHNMYNKGHRKFEGTGNKISYKGKGYNSYAKMAKAYNVDPRNLDMRFKLGWTLEEALEIKVETSNANMPNLYEYYGKLYTVYQLSDLTGINANTLISRLRLGWNVYEACEIEVGRGK